MSDELLRYYREELHYLHNIMPEFGAANPTVAGHLKINNDGVPEDPHVARLLEGVAYMNARIMHRIEDDFPEIANALLGILYPHYVAPIPPMAIAQLYLDPGQTDLVAGHTVPRHSRISADTTKSEECIFRTCYPVTIWPIKVTEARLEPVSSGGRFVPSRATHVLRIELSTLDASIPFAKMQMPAIRFFLKTQRSDHAFRLYELLSRRALSVVLKHSFRDDNPVVLGPSSIKPVGFGPEEEMLPYSARSFPGYRILTEYFAFPDKFLFLDFTGFSAETLATFKNTLEISIFLSSARTELEQVVSASTFRMGCTPIVNLFNHKLDPFKLSHLATRYRLAPDARGVMTEVFSVEQVRGISPDNESVIFHPFYCVRHGMDKVGAERRYWYATREPASISGSFDQGSEVYLTFVDLEFKPSVSKDWDIQVDAICLNRDLAQDLKRDTDNHLHLEPMGAIVRLERLTPVTKTFRRTLERDKLWRIISHLSLNYLSIASSGWSPEALREILMLYDFSDSESTRMKINGIQAVKTRHGIFRTGDDVPGAFCRGIDVELTLDEERYPDGGAYLFACVMDHFLGLYCSINSFSRLTVTTIQNPEDPWSWPPRAGTKVLL